MKPSINVVKRLADELGTTVGYLIGKSKDAQFLKDPSMLKKEEKQSIYSLFDAYIAKNRLQAFL